MAADVKDGDQPEFLGNARRQAHVASHEAASIGHVHSEVRGADRNLWENDQLAGIGLNHWFDETGLINLERVAGEFDVTIRQLAEIIGLDVAAVSTADERASPRTQSRVSEMMEIILRVREWSGGAIQALAWYRNQEISSFGTTAETLVKNGNADLVRTYLDRISAGGYA